MRDQLEMLFDADRQLRKTERELLLAQPTESVADLLDSAVDEARQLHDPEEASMRLERLADLCAQVPGAKMADALIRILDADEPSVRVAAGEALLDVGYERYAEVARAIERALEQDRQGPAMTELPWLLAEIGEPSALPLLRRFAGHRDADVVAASIEALARLGEPEGASTVKQFVDDPREVSLEDEFATSTTLGELARAALEQLDPEQ